MDEEVKGFDRLGILKFLQRFVLKVSIVQTTLYV
jgi:hypothetical protein